MIKLINKTTNIDNNTGQVFLEIKVKIDIEQAQDESTVDPEFYEKFGRAFFAAIN